MSLAVPTRAVREYEPPMSWPSPASPCLHGRQGKSDAKRALVMNPSYAESSNDTQGKKSSLRFLSTPLQDATVASAVTERDLTPVPIQAATHTWKEDVCFASIGTILTSPSSRRKVLFRNAQLIEGKGSRFRRRVYLPLPHLYRPFRLQSHLRRLAR